MSAAEYRKLGEQIEWLTELRRELLEAEYTRLTGTRIGDLVRETSWRGVSNLTGGRGRLGKLVAWDSEHWPHSGRDLPLAKVRLVNRDGSLGARFITFYEWEKERT